MIKKIMKIVSVILTINFIFSSPGLAQVPRILGGQQTLNTVNQMMSQGNNNLRGSGLKGLTSDTSNAFDNKESGSPQKPNKIESPSEIEEYFAKTLTEEAEVYQFKPLKQFGYDIFNQNAVELSSNSDQVISRDYVLGPGDNFSVTMWGIAEGVFNVEVDPEGNIILPKVGVVPVAGVRYGELKDYIEGKLTKYYEQVNVAVSIKSVVGARIYVVGEVRRPGTYNTSSLSTAYNALFLAGGPVKRGSLRDIRVIRRGKTIGRIDLYNLLLAGNRSQDINLIAGDTVFVPVIGPVAAVAGNVKRSGIFELPPRADLSEVIGMAGGVLPTSYVNRVQIQRIVAHDKKIVTDKQFNFSDKNPRFYIEVKDMDLIKIYPIYSAVNDVVYVEGAVKYPGPYQWKNGMTIRDVITAADDLVIGAYLPKAEIVRTDKKTFENYFIDFDLKKFLAGDNSQNYALEARDRVMVSSEFKSSKHVSIEGEVKLPGQYIIGKGERLSSILKRAGGFTDQAYIFGAVFKRQRAKDTQNKAIKELIGKMEIDLIHRSKELSSPGAAVDVIAAKQAENDRNRELIDKFKESALAEGRVIITLKDPELLALTNDDIELEDGDELVIPKIPNTVNILGEVYNPSSAVYVGNKPGSYYLNIVGGVTGQADTREMYVIRADGSIASRRQGYNISSLILMPGDTILVPKSFDRFDFWLAVKDFTHWFYEATLAFAVIATYVKQ